MKRYTAMLCALILILTFASCAKSLPEASDEPAVAEIQPAQTETVPPTQEMADETADTEESPTDTPAPTDTPPAEPTEEPEPTATPKPWTNPGAEPVAQEMAPPPEETPDPESTAYPVLAGTYESEDGSVLVVTESGYCTYETDVSGTVGGEEMSGRLTFGGTLKNGIITFTTVSYDGKDLTGIAMSAGLMDASQWELAAALLYAAS